MSEEQTIFRGSPSILTRFGSLLLATLIGIGAIVGSFLLQQPLLWILTGVAFIYILATVILIRATEYELTTERLRIRTGLLTKRTEEMELYRVQDTSMVEPLTLRIFGLGNIELRTADLTTPFICLAALRDARQVREQLRKHIEECREKKRVRLTEFDSTPPES